MLNFNFIFLLFFSAIGFAFAQSNPSDNKNIGLCNMYSDTLKTDDLKTCGTITILSDKLTSVTSFIFSYYLSDKMDIKLINGFGNSIKKEDMTELLKIKPKKIFIQDVIGERGTENLNIGHRTIYIK
jgi:hypothetical protein